MRWQACCCFSSLSLPSSDVNLDCCWQFFAETKVSLKNLEINSSSREPVGRATYFRLEHKAGLTYEKQNWNCLLCTIHLCMFSRRTTKAHYQKVAFSSSERTSADAIEAKGWHSNPQGHAFLPYIIFIRRSHLADQALLKVLRPTGPSAWERLICLLCIWYWI